MRATVRTTDVRALVCHTDSWEAGFLRDVKAAVMRSKEVTAPVVEANDVAALQRLSDTSTATAVELSSLKGTVNAANGAVNP